jgi:hypothetical protein
MQGDLEHQIRERAYHLWVADGCREGESERYWLTAERELLAQFAATPATNGKKRMSRNIAVTEAASAAPARTRRRAS